MKATTENLDLIDRYLEQRKLDFLDYKLEIKDHLACETEEIMTQKDLAFEDAFGLAIKKWDAELTVKKSWIISNEREFPNVIIAHLKTKIIFRYLTVIILAFISTIYFNLLENKNLMLYDHFRYMICFFTIVHLLLRRVILVKNIKTSYSFQFDYFYMPILFVLVVFFVFNFSFVFAYFVGFLILFDFPISIYFFYKHQNFLKRNKIA
jgi:membrane-associated HD superfamily phosphohydrolase